MKTSYFLLASNFIVIFIVIGPVHLQDIQSRHYRPLSDKCDRYGRCSAKEEHTEEVDDDDKFKPEKERPPIRGVRPIRPVIDDYDRKKEEDKVGILEPGDRYGGSYNPKIPVDKVDEKVIGGGYDIKPSGGRDDDIRTSGGGRPGGGGGYGGGYNPKPVIDKDDDLKPIVSRPGAGGGGYGGGVYKPKPMDDIDDDLKPAVSRPSGGGGGYGGGSYKPKPADDSDDDLKPVVSRPSSGGGGYGGGSYKPKPVDDRDDDLKPVVSRPSSGGGGYGGGSYKPKPADDRDDDLKPVVSRPSSGGGGYGGGSYKPKPADDRDDDLKPSVNRPSSGGGGGGGYGGGSYRPKPVIDRDDDIKPTVNRPSGNGDYDSGGYKPKPAVVRDSDDLKPAVGRPSSNGGGYRGGYNSGGTRGGYNPKPIDDDFDIEPAVGGGGYYPDDDKKSDKDDLGGYNRPKDNDYNEYDDGKYENNDDKPVPVVDGNCICVPYYQCLDGHIVTDGAGIIDARKRPEPDDELPLDGKFKPPSCGPYHVCCNTPETSTVKPYEHRCGVRNPSGINSRILSPSNKGEADFGEWPWQAAVLKAEKNVNIFQCGGVIIDKYHVLTVAHCVFHLYQLNEYPLKVRLGEWDTQTTTEFLAHVDYKVSKIIIHPEYKNTSLWNDIAVLRLQDPVLFAPHIDTVCLPQYDEMFSGQNCVVTGWGKDAYKGGTFSNVMKEVALQVIDNYKCEEMLRKTRLGGFFQLHEGFLCAGGEYGLDSCKGDGGGPLVCYRKDKSYALAGIVSWGIDCGQPSVPGVYVKIQKYLDWISKTTGVTLQEYWPKN